jgi:hypothetical protein
MTKGLCTVKHVEPPASAKPGDEKRREKRKEGGGNADIAGQHTEQVRKEWRECGEIKPD